MGTSMMESPSMIEQDAQLPVPRLRKRESNDDEELDDDPAHFRRVRLRYWDKINGAQKCLKNVRDISEESNLDTIGWTAPTVIDPVWKDEEENGRSTSRPSKSALAQIAASFANQSFRPEDSPLTAAGDV